MEKLSSQEIENIALLLLSPDDKNTALALNLLEHHTYAIPEIIGPIEVFLAFQPDTTSLRDKIAAVLPNYSFLDNPLYLLYLLQFDRQKIASNKSFIQHFEEKGAAYEHWIVQDISRASIYDKLATYFLNASADANLAVKYYRIALRHLPQDSTVLIHLAQTYLKYYPASKRKTLYSADIIACLNQAYELKPSPEPLLNLAKFYAQDLKAVEKAASTWEKCLQQFPNNTTALYEYAYACFNKKHWKKAKELGEQCWNLQKQKPSHAADKLLNLLGLIYWEGFQNHEQAATYFSLSLEENQYYTAPLSNLMKLFLEIDDYPNAIKWHKKALQEQPEDILLMLEIANLYLAIHDSDEAAYYFNEILEIAPNYPPAEEGLKKLGL